MEGATRYDDKALKHTRDEEEGATRYNNKALSKQNRKQRPEAGLGDHGEMQKDKIVS